MRDHWVFWPVLLAMLAALGCGAAEGQVTGQVTVASVALPGGLITFRPADSRQNAVTAELDEQGRYKATLPAGEVSVCIDNRELQPQANLGGGVPAGLPPEIRAKLGAVQEKQPAKKTKEPAGDSSRYVPIGANYYQVETSGLKFKVTGGPQTQNFDLVK